MKKFIILIIFGLFMLQVYSWFSCRDFRSRYHFSVYSLRIDSDNLIHNDVNFPLALVRLYHNKIVLFTVDIYTRYLLFADIKFLVNLLLPVGIFGLFYGFFSCPKDILRRKPLFILTIVMSATPLVEILFKPAIYFPAKILIFSLPFIVFSIFGLAKFMDEKRGNKKWIFLTLLIWLSVWWQIVLAQEFWNFCS